jgi:hypothetical protein
MKSAVFERQQGQYAAALETVSTALSEFPKFAKLYMIRGQIRLTEKQFFFTFGPLGPQFSLTCKSAWCRTKNNILNLITIFLISAF